MSASLRLLFCPFHIANESVYLAPLLSPHAVAIYGYTMQWSREVRRRPRDFSSPTASNCQRRSCSWGEDFLHLQVSYNDMDQSHSKKPSASGCRRRDPRGILLSRESQCYRTSTLTFDPKSKRKFCALATRCFSTQRCMIMCTLRGRPHIWTEYGM